MMAEVSHDYNSSEPASSAYAQRAIFRVMQGGGWFTVRQLSEFGRISDPRSTIRTMMDKGYNFESLWRQNSHGIRYKAWRLIINHKHDM